MTRFVPILTTRSNPFAFSVSGEFAIRHKVTGSIDITLLRRTTHSMATPPILRLFDFFVDAMEILVYEAL
jgi:hypothetical protein